MHKAMGQVLRLQQDLKDRYADHRFAVPQPTLNLGYIQGGDSPNRICGCCELHIDLRPTPQVGPDELMGMLERGAVAHRDPPAGLPASATSARAYPRLCLRRRLCAGARS